MTLLVNGQIETQLPVAQRALDYGDGLFETMRYENSAVALWPGHLSRLMRGAAALGIEQSEAQIESEMQSLLAELQALGLTEGVIKLRLIRGGSQRGYAPQVNVDHWRLFEHAETLPVWGEPEKAMICFQRLADQPQLAGIKHLNRLEQVLAAKEVAESDFTTGLMLDQRGMLCCGVDSNIYLELEDKILTPKLEKSGVQGVFRSYAIERLKESNISVVQHDIEPSSLSQCSGLWLSNAVKGLRPVISVFGYTEWSEDSPILKSLQGQLRDSLSVS